jgi:hypothetical protein
MLWLGFVFVSFMVALVVFAQIWIRIHPPQLDRIHANDAITQLRLDD